MIKAKDEMKLKTNKSMILS